MPLTRHGNKAAVGCHKYSSGVVCLTLEGGFISLTSCTPSTETSHGWDENAVDKYSKGFACPAEFLL